MVVILNSYSSDKMYFNYSHYTPVLQTQESLGHMLSSRFPLYTQVEIWPPAEAIGQEFPLLILLPTREVTVKM